MNLVEAVKTRKPFRRPSDVVTYGETFWVDFMDAGTKSVALDYNDIIADDWEVQPDTAQKIPASV